MGPINIIKLLHCPLTSKSILTVLCPFSRYSACIRTQPGYCCVQYQVCQNVINGFTIDQPKAATLGASDSICTGDYIAVEGE